MTSRSAFVDTNLFVYIYDPRDHRKQHTSRQLINELMESDQATVSTQVIQEFCNVMLSSNIGRPMRVADLKDVLDDILLPILSHVPSPRFYREAVNLHASNSLNFYDALIIQAAIDLNCSVIYSEDLQDGQKFGSLTIKNPFKT